ncbi:acyl carrier protein [bacterium]|nr:MAG: acyl carrier protein [bacterium]
METFNEIISRVFNLTTNEIADSLTEKEIPEWDSMNYLLVISELEGHFNITFDMNEVLNFQSLGDIKNALGKRNLI